MVMNLSSSFQRKTYHQFFMKNIELLEAKFSNALLSKISSFQKHNSVLIFHYNIELLEKNSFWNCHEKHYGFGSKYKCRIFMKTSKIWNKKVKVLNFHKNRFSKWKTLSRVFMKINEFLKEKLSVEFSWNMEILKEKLSTVFSWKTSIFLERTQSWIFESNCHENIKLLEEKSESNYHRICQIYIKNIKLLQKSVLYSHEKNWTVEKKTRIFYIIYRASRKNWIFIF